MALKEYKTKRKFEETPEPKPGRGRKADHLIFVVQKHAARALHYDLRLEMKGTLKSWAVPKGPSLNPSIKRLAVMVEDHPLDYQDFEGVIPEGNYGAGSVIIWDRGFYQHPSAKDRQESEKFLLDGLKRGNLKFVVAGEKLRGEFALVKTGKDEKSWLLFKKNDRYASKDDVLAENRSIVSHRTLEEVSEAKPEKSSGRKRIARVRLREALESEDLKNTPVPEAPPTIKPMLATLVKKPFDHPDWIFEVKWDGYRAIADIRDGNVSLYSRNQISLNKKFPAVADSLRGFGFNAVLDGEIVVVDDEGRPDFQMLQNRQRSNRGHLLYYVFDLLHLDGHDLTSLPLLRRKDLLKKLLPAGSNIRFSDHVREEGVSFFRAAEEKGLEGIIAKRSQSVYRPGKRTRQWLKVKTHITQEAVIAGFTEPKGRRKHFGALVLGVYEGKKLTYIGQCGSGFATKDLKTIYEKMEPLIRKRCPFEREPETNAPVTWLKPKLVCEVSLAGWTEDAVMRQPVFVRLREDKAAPTVAREKLRVAPKDGET